MQVKGVRLYAKDDIRLEEFELPEIKDDEILVKVMSDSICMSTWKMVKQGADHKRVPADVADHPIIIGHEILGSTGGSIDDMKEAIDRAARKEIKPAVMITHVGGIDSIVDTTMNLPNIPGGKKLSYLHINMPMTAISDLRSLAKDDPFFNELADICDRHNGLWSAEAEKALLTHYGVE